MTATPPHSDDDQPAGAPPAPAMHPLARMIAARPLLPLTVIGGSGGLLLMLGLTDAIVHPVLARCLGTYLLLYAGIVVVTMRPSNPFGATVDRVLEEWLRKGSTGFYGLMAFAMFCTLEARGVLDSAAGFEFTRDQLWSMFINWMIGFSVDSLMNTIWASLWPWMLIKDHGPYEVGTMAAIGWGVYWAGARVFPHVHQRLERPRRNKGKPKAKTAGETGAA